MRTSKNFQFQHPVRHMASKRWPTPINSIEL